MALSLFSQWWLKPQEGLGEGWHFPPAEGWGARAPAHQCQWVGGLMDGWWRPWKQQEAQQGPDGALKSPRVTGQSTHKSPKPGLKSLPSPLL